MRSNREKSNDLLPDAVEPTCYPETNTLKNKLNVKNAKELKEEEATWTGFRSMVLGQSPDLIAQTFDFVYLKAIHEYLFQDVYLWAGKPRSFDMAKEGNIFTPAAELKKYEVTAFARAKKVASGNYQDDLSRLQCDLARTLATLNAYHPFPEGNGRSQRVFLSILSKKHDVEILWENSFQWEMIEVCKAAHVGNYDPIIEMMQRICMPSAELVSKSNMPEL